MFVFLFPEQSVAFGPLVLYEMVTTCGNRWHLVEMSTVPGGTGDHVLVLCCYLIL